MLDIYSSPLLHMLHMRPERTRPAAREAFPKPGTFPCVRPSWIVFAGRPYSSPLRTETTRWGPSVCSLFRREWPTTRAQEENFERFLAVHPNVERTVMALAKRALLQSFSKMPDNIFHSFTQAELNQAVRLPPLLWLATRLPSEIAILPYLANGMHPPVSPTMSSSQAPSFACTNLMAGHAR